MREDEDLSQADLRDLVAKSRARTSVAGALALLAEKGMPGLLGVEPLTAYRALLKRCYAIRYDDPKQMVHLANIAVAMACCLSVDRYGSERVADYLCRGLIELANAYRVADQLNEAGVALGEATTEFWNGSKSEYLKARMFDIQASLFADRRNFPAAATALDTVFAIYRKRRKVHLAGRALISKGVYVGYGGDPREAIRLLREGLSQVNPKRDPRLLLSGVQCQAHFLIKLGQFRQARNLIWGYHFTPEMIGGKINQLKFRWLQAQIQVGLGDIDRAEAGLIEAREGFIAESLHYKAALASLELAQLWLRKGKRREVREMVVELVQVFKAYHIHREAFAGLMLLEAAFAEDIQDVGAILDVVTDFVKRAETDPDVKFPDWFPV